MRTPINEMRLTIESRSINEAFSRVAVSAFAAQLDPTVEEISDIKTAVSEAVTNCIVHAYENTSGRIYITAKIFEGGQIVVKIRDRGCGIPDIKQAMTPLYTSKGGERSGLGFSVMESFMDKVTVYSNLGRGTTVTLLKQINGRYSDD
ncbi:MAG: anti-sigma F factor [Oscillospiraceae bacterium]|jgi:stage II sporulation protein AB (anti-sigma F factor)|nr:anti-sigma F factor [Oscillospiraceae bacterium]